MVNEVLPVLSGLIAGIVLGGVTARRRPWVWIALCVTLGSLATVVSGELAVSWAYLLVDIALVGATSVAAFLLSRGVRRRQLRLA